MRPTPSSSAVTTVRYVAPFVAFVALLQLDRAISLPPEVFYPIRFATVTLVLLLVSRPVIALRPSARLLSCAVGVVVFVVWIAPDLLFGYRQHWLFQNSVIGSAVSSVPGYLRHKLWFAILRTSSSVLLVPVLEELFWRGWLM